MNWKYLAGKYLQFIEDKLLKTNSIFVFKNFPYGRNWIYDIKRILNQTPINIIDAGANIGEVAKDLSFQFPTAAIYSFEPFFQTYERLLNNVLLYENILPQNLGLGKTTESLEVFLNPESTINSIKSTYLNEKNSLGKEIIHIIRLDEFCNSNKIDHINILKIDVEGFELEVLKGSDMMLKNQIDCILVEVGYEREETKVHFSDIEIYLEKYNFQLCGIYEIMRNLNDKRKIAYSNNLYIKKELLKK